MKANRPATVDEPFLFRSAGQFPRRSRIQRRRAIMQFSGRHRVRNCHPGLKNDISGVDFLTQEKSRHARFFLAVDNGPIDGSRPAVFRQKGGMKVECPFCRNRKDLRRQDAKRHDDKQVRTKRRERGNKIRARAANPAAAEEANVSARAPSRA